MPRDVSGHYSDTLRSQGGERPTLGAALRTRRQSEGLTLEQLAAQTRVRRAYLHAIEEGAWSALPSGPYAAGYVRLYANALGLNGEKAVEALREELPIQAHALPAPVGLAHQDRPRWSPIVIAAAAVLGVAVVGWNVAQRASLPVEEHVAPPIEALAWRNSTPTGGVIPVSAALPPPLDQNAPAPYETPGMAAAMAVQAGQPAAAGAPAANPAAAAPVGVPTATATAIPTSASAPAMPVGASFNPRGAIHGAAPQESRLTVQARSSASVIVRRANGDIVFARQLAAGEAYRAPLETGLVLDVSDPAAFDVYRDGEFRGPLSEQQNRVERLLG